jgi:hypothetical protein
MSFGKGLAISNEIGIGHRGFALKGCQPGIAGSRPLAKAQNDFLIALKKVLFLPSPRSEAWRGRDQIFGQTSAFSSIRSTFFAFWCSLFLFGRYYTPFCANQGTWPPFSSVRSNSGRTSPVKYPDHPSSAISFLLHTECTCGH